MYLCLPVFFFSIFERVLSSSDESAPGSLERIADENIKEHADKSDWNEKKLNSTTGITKQRFLCVNLIYIFFDIV